MQVGNIGSAGGYSATSTEGKVTGDPKPIESDSSETTSLAVKSDSVSISSEAMRLLDEDSSTTSDSNASEVVPLGNGSGTIPDLNSTTSGDDPTPGNGSGTVPPDLGGN